MSNEILDQQEEIKQPVFPNLWQSIGLLGYCILVQIAAGLVFAPVLSNYADAPLMGPLVFLLLYVLMFGLVLWYAQRQRARHQGNTNFSFRTIPMMAYFLIFILTFCVSILLEPIVEWLPMPEELYESLMAFAKRKDVFTFLTLAVAAPIFEELIFRGVILDGLLKNYSPGKAIFWSAFIFGIVHLNPWQFVTAFAAGLMMGWLYWKSNSLLPGIFFHFIINSIAFGTRFFIDLENPTAMENSTKVMVGEGNYAAVFIASTLIGGACIWLLNGILKPKSEDYTTGELIK